MTAPAPPDDAPSFSLAGYRVLFAEDERVSQLVTATMLRSAGAEVELVSDGLALLDIALANPMKFGIVLVDVEMPSVNGLVAAQRLRTAGFGAPIVALTAHDGSDMRVRCEEAGCDAYLTKPLRKEVLIETVYAVLTGLMPRSTMLSERRPRLTSLYWEEELLRDLIVEWVDELNEKMSVLSTAEMRRDRTAMQRVGHQLKGTAAGFGYPEVGVVAARLEDIARGEGRLDDVIAASEALRAICSVVRTNDAARESSYPGG